MKNPRVLAAIAGTVLVLIVVLQNTESVRTDILFFQVTMPRAALLFTCAAIGFVVGIVTGVRYRRKAERHKPQPPATT